jgi:predicted PurR-regulated permease PerM
MYVPIGSAPEISILEKSMTSSTNEIVIKKSFISTYVVQVIITLVFLSVVLIFLFFFLLRRGNSDRKFRKENEKRLEAQWKQERDRRRKIWKNKGILPQRDPSPRYYDEYEEEN